MGELCIAVGDSILEVPEMAVEMPVTFLPEWRSRTDLGPIREEQVARALQSELIASSVCWTWLPAHPF